MYDVSHKNVELLKVLLHSVQTLKMVHTLFPIDIVCNDCKHDADFRPYIFR